MRGVVEDVHPRVLGTKLDDAVDEQLERGLFGVEVVRPRALVAGVRGPPAPEVFDAFMADVGVTFEVKKDIADAGFWQQRVAGRALGREVSMQRLAAVARAH